VAIACNISFYSSSFTHLRNVFSPHGSPKKTRFIKSFNVFSIKLSDSYEALLGSKLKKNNNVTYMLFFKDGVIEEKA